MTSESLCHELCHERRLHWSSCPLLLVLVLLLLFSGSSLFAGNLSDKIRRLQKKYKLDSEDVGIQIMQVPGKKIIYNHHDRVPFIPASTAKIITAFIALKTLGPDDHFQTRLYATPNPPRKKIRNLYVLGDGDPNISGRFHEGEETAVFQSWASQLQKRGIQRIDGNIILDGSRYHTRWIHPTWEKEDLLWWYAAPVGPFIFEDSCVRLIVKPSSRIGRRCSVKVEPKTDLINIRNRTKTISRKKSGGISFDRNPNSRDIVVSGTFPRKGGARVEHITVPNPTAYFGEVLKSVFQNEGIRVDGIQTGTIPTSVRRQKPVITFRSSLMKSMKVMLEKSQNLYAETIFKRIALHQEGKGSWRGASRISTRILNKLGVPLQNSRITDGSGLSRKNQLTPRALVSVLYHWWKTPRLRPYLSLLPDAGREGTLKNRLNGSYTGHIQAKTGTMSGVVTLSGFAGSLSMDNPNSPIALFSVFINKKNLSYYRARRFCDEIAKISANSIKTLDHVK